MIRLTLLSAALQEYPDKRVVLLIDDPPEPRYAKAQRLLADAARAARRGRALLAEPARRFSDALARFELADVAQPARSARRAARARRALRLRRPVARPARRRPRRRPHRAVLRRRTSSDSSPPISASPARRCAPPRPRTASIPRAQAHAPVPATRLDVPGGAVELRAQALRVALPRAEQGDEPQQLHRPDGRHATARCRPPPARCSHPAGARRRDLDGARLRLRPHARRRQRAAARVLRCARLPARAAARTPGSAVAQTPYSAYPGAATRLERIAGATTDLQHIVHQGLTLLRRHVLGRRQRRAAQAGARRHRRDRVHRRLVDAPLHPRPHGDRGHRVEHRLVHPGWSAATTTPSG